MDEKIGAGNKLQVFNKGNGRYVKEGAQGYNSQSDIQPLQKAVGNSVNLPEKAYGFEDNKRKYSPDHIQHAKEMGYKNQDFYEQAAVDFWENGQGEEYYGTKRGRFAKYNENTGEYVVVDKDGTLKTYYKISLKKFERIKNQEGFEKWKK